jgi:cell wall-associated NlpC family hydrolase
VLKRRALAVSVTACTLLCLVIGRPALAEPGGSGVPDAGSRPPAVSVPTPGQETGGGTGDGVTIPAGSTMPADPLGQQIQKETDAVQQLATQLATLDQKVEDTAAAIDTKQVEWDRATAYLAQLEQDSDSAAADAYKRSRELGPLGDYADDFHQYSKVHPGIGEQPGGTSTALELSRARTEELNARQSLDAARQAHTTALTQRDAKKTEYDQRSAALQTLRAQNAAAIAAADAANDAYQSGIGSQLGLGGDAAGSLAHADVAKVIAFAMSKLGKPYIFGDEGPNSYDCSGLTWDSYRQVGVNLPRIANSQYAAGTKVPRNALLPGDLLFFGPPGPWQGIGHVTLYIGGDKMIEAPTTGQVVKISQVRWTSFYGATRPLPARSGPPPATTNPPGGGGSNPNPTPTPTPTPTPSPTPPPSSPAPDPSASSPKPIPDPTTSSPAPQTPSPSPAPPASTSQSPAASPSTRASASSAASASGSAGA